MNTRDFVNGYAVGYNDGLENSSGNDKWVRPSDWPAMPEPADNQLIMLISTQWNTNPYEQYYIYAHGVNGDYALFDGTTSVSIDWGDGATETIDLKSGYEYYPPLHYYYDTGLSSWNDGPILENGAHVFVVTVTLPDNAYIVRRSPNNHPLEIYVGKNVKFWSNLGTMHMLEHVKLFGWQPSDLNHYIETSTGFMSNCPNLRKVSATEPLTKIAQNMFNRCRALDEIDLSECTEVEKNGLAYTGIKEINSEVLTTLGELALTECYSLTQINAPNLSEAGASALYNCYGITKINAPKLSVVGAKAMQNCYMLEEVVHAEEWTYETNSFTNIYRWYDNPTLTHPQIG